jgi:hypothetical protein
MIKKKMTLISVIFAILFVILGIVLYRMYIVPFYQNNVSQTVTITMDKNQQLVLVKNPEQEHIFSIEIEVTGSSKNNFELLVSNPSKTLVHNARLKGGTIDFIYATDWFDDTCFIDISMAKPSYDKLEVECRFIGTKQ